MPDGEPVAVYIDTGSVANILDPKNLRRLGLRSQPTSARLSGFGGGRAVASDEVKFTLMVDGCRLDVEAIVAPLLGQLILNGRTVLLEVQREPVRLARVEEYLRRSNLGDESAEESLLPRESCRRSYLLFDQQGKYVPKLFY